MPGKSIRIYLSDGTVKGIRYAELVNWTGHAIACPRNRLSELTKWQEAEKPGVYFLFESQFTETKPTAYIGESENVLQRLASHDRNKDFWNEVIIFTSKDENLTKAHVKFLESTLVAIALKSDRFAIENANTPTESSLPRADKDAMLEFIENIRMVLGVLGYFILEPILDKAKMRIPNANENNEEKYSPLGSLKFSTKNLTAYGAQTDEGFVLKKDSELSIENSNSMSERQSAMKNRLFAEGKLKKENNKFITTEDILLSSSSYAAVMVAGTARNGPENWKSEDGRTLRQLEDSLLKEVSK